MRNNLPTSGRFNLDLHHVSLSFPGLNYKEIYLDIGVSYIWDILKDNWLPPILHCVSLFSNV